MSSLRPMGVALGSNQGDRLDHLKMGWQWLKSRSRGPVRASRIYETHPVGCEPGTESFLNAVGEIHSDEEPLVLLRLMREFERERGRPESYPRNAPRTLDMDMLYAGDVISDTPELVLPHPRLLMRRFVLQPLCDIRPELILPGQAQSVGEIFCSMTDVDDLRVFKDQMD